MRSCSGSKATKSRFSIAFCVFVQRVTSELKVAGPSPMEIIRTNTKSPLAGREASRRCLGLLCYAKKLPQIALKKPIAVTVHPDCNVGCANLAIDSEVRLPHLPPPGDLDFN